MRFMLFSKTEFEVSDAVALIECYCFQCDFYKNYDLLLPARSFEAVSKIGARISEKQLEKCGKIIEDRIDLPIFKYNNNLDEFLGLSLRDETIGNHVGELSNLIRELMDNIDGIRLSKATKILHTRYPGIVPIIDNQLQNEYKQINKQWKGQASQILLDYYKNLKGEPNKRNLAQVYETVSKSVSHLTKLRVFDVPWWSFLKAKALKDKNKSMGLCT